MSVACSKGHRHDYEGYCESDDCAKCISDGHLSGFTGRAVAAIAHLREAWLNADATNKPGIEAAITAVFSTRSFREQPDRYLPYLVHGLDDGLAQRITALTDDAISALNRENEKRLIGNPNNIYTKPRRR